ncbi:hypothetical protein [Streptomyces goshikiensis]|uniref:hypothetical protein n=1 Tax=Streptomyces goshikiensis TaxID=1942 RepID=UPI0037FD1F43
MFHRERARPHAGADGSRTGSYEDQAGLQQIYAENDAEQFALHVTGNKKSATGNAMILFEVVSKCFKAESAKSLDGEY